MGAVLPTGNSSRSAASLVQQVAEARGLIATTRRQAPPRATAKFAAGDLTSIAKSDAGDSREPREEGEPTLGLAILAKKTFLLFLFTYYIFVFLLLLFVMFILQLCILFVTYKVKEHGI
jgi:hypothetical protein